MHTLTSLQAFRDEEHRPFLWAGDANAALLLHGFPGTPAEMRPLAHSLHQAGWTVQGLLLPGFGAQIDTLAGKTATDWIEAACSALANLQRSHQQVALVGYSMGGAVALNAAAVQPPDSLVLLAPFWKLGNGLQSFLWPLLKRLFPTFHPFRDADFSDPVVRENIGNLFPNQDLDDPAMQKELQEFTIPASILDQLRRIGLDAYANAPKVTTPGLIIQGTADETSTRQATRALLARLASPIEYHEIPTDHQLVRPENGGFLQVERLVRSFLET